MNHLSKHFIKISSSTTTKSTTPTVDMDSMLLCFISRYFSTINNYSATRLNIRIIINSTHPKEMVISHLLLLHHILHLLWSLFSLHISHLSHLLSNMIHFLLHFIHPIHLSHLLIKKVVHWHLLSINVHVCLTSDWWSSLLWLLRIRM